MEIEIHIAPQGRVLQEYMDCTSRVQMIRGPLGSGKTTASCLKIQDIMCSQKPNSSGIRLTRWVAVRNTYSELFTTTIKDWLDIFGEFGQFSKGGKEPPNQKLSFKLDDGTRVQSEVWFIAFDRPDHVKKARGLQLTGVWLNEVKELPKSVVDLLDLRHGRYPSRKEGVLPSWHGMIGDYNAPDDDHWLYKLAEEEKPKGWTFFHQPGGLIKNNTGEWIENPKAENIKNLPTGYYLNGMAGKAEDWIRVNLANEYGFVRSGKPVHPRYIDSIHCREIDFKPDIQRPIILGFDFGRTPACEFLQRTPSDGWICFDELTSEDMSASSFAPFVRRYIDDHYPGYTIRAWGDPAGNTPGQASDATPIGILRINGIPCSGTSTNDPIPRRAALETPMTEIGMDGLPRFVILPKCKMARKGLAGGFAYRRIQVVGEERYTDIPDKNQYSHPVEALEYGLQGEGEGRLLHKDKLYSDWAVPING